MATIHPPERLTTEYIVDVNLDGVVTAYGKPKEREVRPST
jgi:hypothetical protein